MAINRQIVLLSALALVLGLSTCNRTSDSSAPIRLVDAFRPEMVKGTPNSVAKAEKLASWDFSKSANVPNKDAPATLGWQTGANVSGLTVKSGRLVGRSTDEIPIIYVTQTVENDDLVHSIEIRMRVSKGSDLSVSWQRKEELNFKDLLPAVKQVPWLDKTPLIPGDAFQTYSIEFSRPTAARNFRHLLIRPTDSASADFELESVRLVSRREHLQRVPSGVGWQGLAEIYRETLIARSPERIEMEVDVPDHPWLDLNVGTVEFSPVTFKVGVSGGNDGQSSTLLERTITKPQRWESVPVDLSAYQGRRIRLSLSLQSGEAGDLGFWGSPVIRSNGSAPLVTRQKPADPSVETGEAPRGVILIVADTLRRDHLNFYGCKRETAPFLTRLAGEGALFTDTISQATWTKASMPSIMTSLYPSQEGVKEFSDRLPAGANTMAEVFRSAGYATVSYSSVAFSGRFTNLHQGFEELHEAGSVPDRETNSKTAREYVDRLTAWLELHRNVPFFVFLHVFDPHDPFEPYPPYNGIWADLGKKEEHLEQVKKVRELITDPSMKRRGLPSREELIKAGLNPEEYVSYNKDWYDGSIRALDAEISRLYERLRGLSLSDKTLLVFSSDHGEEFLEHGHMFHGQSVYGELNQVPLFFHLPGVVPRTVVDGTVQSIDIMPTILEICRLAEPPKLSGHSLTGQMSRQTHQMSRSAKPSAVAFASEAGEPRPAFTEKQPTKGSGGPEPKGVGSVALVWNGWKLIQNYQRSEGMPEYELYRRTNDPLDQHDLAQKFPEQVTKMRAMIETWRKSIPSGRLPEDKTGGSLSSDELQRLRSLGYVK